jgi:hypothetical protein
MADAQDATQSWFSVGDIVNVPCRVTAVGGTTAQPALSLTTIYTGFAGTTDDITGIDSKQVEVRK